jgi:protein O-mannosyl-transferase
MTKKTRRQSRAVAADPGTANVERGIRWRAALLTLAGALVYLNSLSAPFIFDDQIAVVDNPAIRSLSGAWSQPRNTPLAGRPIAAFTFAVNYALNGIDPAPYRATNVAIHIACALLLFAIVRRTLAVPRLQPRFGAAADDLAFASALLWVVHPLTTDAVTYITQRTESLMALCYLLTLYASLQSASRRQTTGDGRWTVVAIIACAVGIGVKESMVTAPVVVVLFDRVFLFDSLRTALAARWRLYLGLSLTWLVLIYELSAAPREGSAGFGAGVSVWTYLLNQSVMVARYLRLSVWPSDLVINYGPPVPYALADVIPQAAFIVAILALTVAAFRWNPAAAFLGVWFIVTLAPSSSFVPIATEVGAERRMYLPLMAVGVAMVLALFSARQVRLRVSRNVAATALVIVAIALGTATIRRNAEHHSWLRLAQTTLERWPTDVARAMVGSELALQRRDEEALPLLRVGARSDVRARYNLGVTLFNLKRYDEAIGALDVLVNAHPMREEVPWSRRLMGHAYMRLARWSDAITQLRMTLAMTPDDAEARRLLVDAYNSFGVDLAQAQRFDDAVAQFRDALSYDADNASATYNLATALFDAGQMIEAFAEADRAIALDPANADAHHLKAKLLALQGRTTESIASFETAVKLRPEDPVIWEDFARLDRRNEKRDPKTE